ncbi:unnamed protein product [Ectocarpus sp. 6 AP-2014]
MDKNAFGIAYEPLRGSSQKSYDLPSGPAFVDEDEFEQEMSAEFRVTVGPSRQGEILATMSNRTQADDFAEGDGTADITMRTQQQGVPGGNGSERQEDVNSAPFYPGGLRLDNREALKQLTKDYKVDGVAPHVHPGNAPQRLDQSAKEIGGRSINSSLTDNAAGILEFVGEDVRHYPVTEEENERAEEDDDDEERKNLVEVPEKMGTLNVPGEREKEGQTSIDEDESAQRALVAKEWEAIDQLRTAERSVPMEKGVGGKSQPISIDQANRLVTTAEVLGYFRSQDLCTHKAAIVPYQPPESRFGLFRRASKLRFPDAEQLRDEVFILAQIKYAPADVVHRRLIQTIYRRMTNEKRACPDVGPHWDTVGFQGTDPCTDLNRSMGIFALFQVLHLLESQLGFAMVLYRLSLADVTGWPFMCVSIGFTKEALRVLRRGGCYAECNRRGSVLDVVHELHQAQFHAFLELCRTEPATHHALHLAKVRARVETDSHVLVKAYRTYLLEEKARSAVSIVDKTGGSTAVQEQFSGGGKLAQDGPPVALVKDTASRKNTYLS